MTRDAARDEIIVRTRPIDRPAQAVSYRHARLKAKQPPRFLRRSEAGAGTVPVPGRSDRYRLGIADELVDEIGEITDPRFHPGGKIVDLTTNAVQRCFLQAVDQVVDVHEIAARQPAILKRKRIAMQRLPYERRRHVAPDRVHCPAPAASAENFARTVDILETRFDNG